MQRARSACVARGECTEPAVANFTRLMMKNGERESRNDTICLPACLEEVLCTNRHLGQRCQDVAGQRPGLVQQGVE